MITAARRSRSAMLGQVSLARNVLANWTAIVLTILSTFFITPIVVATLQKESYGVWSFLNGLLVYSDLLYVGLGSALIKSVAACRANAEHENLNRVSSSVLSIYGVIGLVCFGALASVSAWVPGFFAHPLLTPQADKAATIACALLGVQLLASFVGSGFSGVLYGLDRVDLVGFVRVAILSLRMAAIVLLIGGANPLVTLAIITAGGTVVETIGLGCLAFLVNPHLAIKPVVPTRAELRVLYGFGLQSFIVLFALTLINYTDTTVIGVMISASSVALYSLPLQLVEYIRVAASSVSGVLLPRLTVMATQGDLRALRAAYLTIARATLYLATFVSVNMIFLGASFLGLWVGPEFSANIQGVIVCLSLATLLHIFAITGPMGFYQAMETLRVPAIALLVEALANLALSVFLAPRMGILGVAVGSLIPASIVGCFVLPPYLWRNLEIKSSAVFRAVFPSVVLFAAMSLVLWALRWAYADTSYLRVATKGLLTLPAAVLVFSMFFPRDEREWLVRELTRLFNVRAKLAARKVAPADS